MKSETLTQHHPPTPPNVSNELHSGLHQIAQYNADRSYSFDDLHHQGSAYGSPGSMVYEALPHHPVQSFQTSPADSQPGQDFGLNIQYVRKLVKRLKERLY